MLWDHDVHGTSPCYDSKGRGATIHRCLEAQIHQEGRKPTEEITTSEISSYSWQRRKKGRWLLTMSSPKRQAAAWSNLILILTSNLPNTPSPQFARFTGFAKAAPGRRCSSHHSLTREVLFPRGRIVFCVESCTRHCLSRPPP